MGNRRAGRRRRAREGRDDEAGRAAERSPAPGRWTPSVPALASLAGPVAIAIAAGVMLARTWETWPDVIVDFGRELYLAWRLAEGDTLYADASHFSGPLSPYLNALWFRLFGVGLRTLVLANIALAAGVVALLYGHLARLAGRLAATMACLVFVALFACGQFTRIGNYNWVCPYSHELTHGVLLVVLALCCLEQYHRTRRATWLGGLGVVLGLVVLTKAEIVLAGAAAAGVGLLLTGVVERPSAARAARLAAIVAGAAAVPLALVAAAFSLVMPFAEVVRWPLGHWHAAARPELRGTAFYQEGLGVADLAGNLTDLGIATLGYGALAVAASLAAIGARRLRVPTAFLAGAAFVATAMTLGRLVSLDAWAHGAPRALPVVMILLVAVFAVAAVRRRDDRDEALRAVRAAALCAFALAALAKMILNVRLFHYGFALAMPATMVLVVAMMEWLPAAVARVGGRAAIVRAVALGALVAAVVPQLRFMDRLLATKVHRVGRGADAFWADDRALAVVAVVDEVRRQVGPADGLVSIPEGAMVNYLARRVNPTPYYLFDGLTLPLWGEQTMIAALEAAAPEWVALVDRGGAPRFGRSVAAATYAWATRHYRPVWRRGVPFDGGRAASVALLRRRD